MREDALQGARMRILGLDVLKRLRNKLQGGIRRSRRESVITVVSGLPRSGTSMMMKMLEAGGMSILSDGVREPDIDNPAGYCELERVKKLKDGDSAWLVQARGKAVKIVSELLKWLPSQHEYRVVFMRRDLNEVLASQRTMLLHKGETSGEGEEETLKGLFARHLETTEAWLDRQVNIEVLYVSYNALLAEPGEHLEKVNRFLGDCLDVASMADVIDPALYRQRRIDSLAEHP